MYRFCQSPTDPDFVRDPYPAYAAARQMGELVFWEDYGMPAALGHRAVSALLRDRRFGREIPAELASPPPAHLAAFHAVEDHSLLDAEPPRHTRLRTLVLRAFTSRAIAGLEPGIAALCHALIDRFPEGPFDLLDAYCRQVPVIVIARLLGVPETAAPDLLRWSNAMVAMYQAGRTRATEDRAAAAAADFSAFLRAHVERRRGSPGDDLISALIAAGDSGDRLSTDEMIATCILLLNAGHEATVASLGLAVAGLLSRGFDPAWLAPDSIPATVEELLRHDPPLHMFTRYAYEDVTLFGHDFRRGDQVALVLGAAGRDPTIWPDPDRFDPTRAGHGAPAPHSAFGGGIHFCLGAPLARMELRIALPILFQRCPALRLAAPPDWADSYHFHGLSRLRVET